MGDKYAGPDYSDIAESMASGFATGAITPMGKSFGKQLYKMGKKAKGVADSLVEESQRSRARRKVGQNETGFNRVSDDSFPNGRLVAKPNAKINLRKEYKD